MSFLHERLLKLFNKEIINIFKADPSIFENSDEAVQSKSEIFGQKNDNVDQNRKKINQIFDKEFFVNNFDDVMSSKFKMYDFIEMFYKDGGMLSNIEQTYKRKNFEEIQILMEKTLELIK